MALSQTGLLAAKNLDQLFEFEPRLMNQLLALVGVHLRVVAREAVQCAANGKPLLGRPVQPPKRAG